MKKIFNQLIALAPGKLFLDIDPHKKFGEKVFNTIQQDVEGEFKKVDQTTKDLMISNNSIIRVEAHPETVMVSVVEYSHDLETALKKALKSIKLAAKEAKKNG